jgi:hypothetical protein
VNNTDTNSAWSALREHNLRRRWESILGFYAVAIVAGTVVWGGKGFCATLVAGGLIVHLLGRRMGNEMRAMEANRPTGGGAGLTVWVFHSEIPAANHCACGAEIDWDRGFFTGLHHPSPRLVVHCGCGKAHYKLSTSV